MNRVVNIPVDGIELRFVVRPLRLTREYVDAQMLLGSNQDLEPVIDFLWSHIVLEEMNYPSLSRESFVPLVGEEGVGALLAEVLTCGMEPEVLTGARKLLRVVHRANEYDPAADPVCECRACSGQVEKDPLCLFEFKRPVLSDLVAGWDWELIERTWDKPFYVYQAMLEHKRAQAQGEAAMHQEHKRKLEDDRKAKEIRQKHFGTADWGEIARQRGA